MEQVARRITIADVAERAGVSKTAVSFAFNSPDRLERGHRQPDPRHRPGARLPAGPGRPDADPAADRDDRRPDAAGAGGHLREPVLRGVQRGGRDARRGARLRPPLHLAAPRLAVAGDPPGDRRRRRRDRPDRRPPRDRRDPAGRPADGPRRLGHDRPRRLGRRRRRGRRDPRCRAISLELGHRDIAILAIDGPPSAPHAGGGVVGRRLRGYRTALAEAGIEVPEDEIATGPASIDGGRAAFATLWEAGRRPTAVLAMSDAMAIGAIRAIRERGLTVPGRRQRRRLRRHRPRRVHRPAAHHGPPARPRQGRGGGPPAAVGHGRARPRARAPAARDPPDRPGLDRAA